MANQPRPAAQRDVFAQSDAPSRGFFGLLSLVLFQPQQFFKQIAHVRHTLTVALLILALVAYSAVQQASPASSSPIDSGGVPPMDGGEFPPIEGGGEFPLDTGGATTTSDPSESWMTGLTAAGTLTIYWAVLAIVLSEVSLFNGQTPNFGLNLQIAIWSSTPLALMAGVQILFMMGGGTIGAAGFAGFLAEWESFSTLNIYLQSALYALAMQISLFWLWSLALVYIGGKEALKGKPLGIILVLVIWIGMLVVAYGFQSYEKLKALQPDYGMGEFPIEGEFPVEGEFPIEGEMSQEGEGQQEGEMPSDGGKPLQEVPETGSEGGSEAEQEAEPAPARSGGKG